MNYSRHDHALPLAPLLRWVFLLLFFLLLALCYVHMKIRLTDAGNERRELERDIANLDQRLLVAENEITRRTSRAALQKRLSETPVTMIPVADTRMKRLRAVRPGEMPELVQAAPAAETEGPP